MNKYVATRVVLVLCAFLAVVTVAAASDRPLPVPSPLPSDPGRISRRWLFDPLLAQWVPVGESSFAAERSAATSLGLVETQDFPISTAIGWQLSPTIAAHNESSEILIAWEDARNGIDLDIYGQRLAADGHLLGGNFALVIGEYDQCAPSLFPKSGGEGYLLLWHHQQRDYHAVYGQCLSMAGTPMGAPFRIPAPNNGQQWIPGGAYNDVANEFLIVWEDMFTSEIMGQRITADGDLIGEAIVISTRPKSQWAPPYAVFNGTREEYLVVWDELGVGDIYGQIVRADGTLLGENLAISTVPGKQFVSSVTYNSNSNEYLILWTDERALETHDGDIYGQRIDADGVAVGNELAIANAPQWQRNAVAAYDSGHDEYLIVWWDGRGISTANDIYGQRLSASGVLLGSNLPISTAASNQVYPNLIYRAADDLYAIVWQDWRNDDGTENNADIYGLLYSAERYCFYFPQCVKRYSDHLPAHHLLMP